ncbi:MAG: hypothetical protein V1887_04355 [Candidatus Aenigmatarchaeota archaeon]
MVTGPETSYEVTEKGREKVEKFRATGRVQSYDFDILNRLNNQPDTLTHLRDRLGDSGMYRGPDGLAALKEYLDKLEQRGDIRSSKA